MMEKVQILNIGIQNLTEQQLLESLNVGVAAAITISEFFRR